MSRSSWQPDRLLQIAVDAAGMAWMDDALCAEVGGDIHFPEKGESPAPAKRICAACGVRGACLEYALENRIEWGIWGGFSAHQRRGMRPGRKAAAA